MYKMPKVLTALLLSVLLACPGYATAQNARIDSLKPLLAEAEGLERIDLLNKVALEYWDVDSDSGFYYSAQALDLAEKAGYDRGAYLALIRLGIHYRQKREYEKSENTLIRAVGMIEKVGDINDLSSVYYLLGYTYSRQRKNDKALEYYLKRLEADEKIGDRKQIAESINRLGIIYDRLGRYKDALERYITAKDIFEELGDRRGIASQLNNIGVIYVKQSQFDKGLEYYLHSLKIKEELGNKESISRSLNNIGIVYKNMKDYENALKYYNRSLELKIELNDRNGIARTYNNMGIVYMVTDRYEEALDYYGRSLSAKEELGDIRGMGVTYNNIGIVHKNLGEFSEALDYFGKSLEIKEKEGNERGIVESLNHMATIYIEQKLYVKAEATLNRSLEISSRLGVRDKTSYNYSLFAELNKQKKDYKKALDYFELNSALKDSIFSEESDRAVAEMRTKYETEQKEQEIEMLRKDNRIQQLDIEGQKMAQKLMVGGFLFVIITSFLVYNRYHIRKESHVELLNAKAEVDQKVKELEKSILHIQKLEGLLPICCSCKKIRTDAQSGDKRGNWVQIEKYITDRTKVDFSHGICPDCRDKLYPDYPTKNKPAE